MNHRRIDIALIVMGASGIVAQVVFMREMIVIFYGNELLLGLLLGTWLLSTAIGSGVIGRLAGRIHNPVRAFGLLQIVISLLLPLSLLLTRASPLLWRQSPGEIVGLLPMTITPLVVLAPLCISLGFLYTLGCRSARRDNSQMSIAIGRVYILESVGATVGGLLVSLVLIRLLNSFQIVVLLGIINLASAWMLIITSPHTSRLKGSLLCLALGVAFLLSANRLEDWTNRQLWRGFTFRHSENSIYGNISVVSLGATVSFYENGLLAFTYPDLMSAEEAVHLGLLQHPQPESVLLIGGGMGGRVTEALKTPTLRRLDYVELDPKIIELGRTFLPPQETKALDDPRVTIHHIDGRLFVQTTDARYDAVIVDLPDPNNTMVNRFFTREFFGEVRRILTPGGILSFRITSSENVIGDELARFLRCLRSTLLTVFPQVVVLPGNMAHFIACSAPRQLTEDVNIMLDRLAERQLNTVYVREYYLPFHFSKERMDYMRDILSDKHVERINTDFRPVAYFYDLILWSRQFNPSSGGMFEKSARLGSTPFWIAAVLLVLGFALAKIVRKDPGQRFKVAVVFAILVVGFSEIALEVICVVAFQALFGYVYFQVALLVTGYMAGLAVGGLVSSRWLRGGLNVGKRFRVFQIAMVLFPLVLLGILKGLSSLRFSPLTTKWSAFLFPLITFAAGYIGGYQFPLANELFSSAKTKIEKVAGTIYATDLLGSCAGAFVAAAFLIPTVGLPETLLTLCGLNLAVLICLIVS